MLSLLLLVACDPPPPEKHTLTDLYRPVMVLNTGGTPGTVQAFLHPLLNGPCHPIDNLTATLGEQPLERLHGKVKQGDISYDRDCSVFEFTGKEPAAAPTLDFVVTDGTSTGTMQVADLLAPRTITGPATAKPGDDVALTWAPATDVFADKGEIGIELRTAPAPAKGAKDTKPATVATTAKDTEPDGSKRVVIPRKSLKIEGNVLHFTMPDTVSGPVDVTVIGTAHIQPKVLKCEWAYQCEVSRAYDVAPIRIDVHG
jgi:hypothetical protein